MLKKLSNALVSFSIPRYYYNVLSLLESKHEQQFIKINPALFSLYLYKLLHHPFNERFSVLMMTDCYRTSQSKQHFQLIANHSLQNLQLFSSRTSLVTLLNQMYHYKYGEREKVQQLVRRALEIKQVQDSGYAFYNLKLLIAVDQLIGLQSFDEEVYRAIDFKKFRPLMLAMAIELFYNRQLQHRFGLVQDLVDMFVACESFIPFADMHHLTYSIRKIDNQKFKACFFRVRRRIQQSIKGRESVGGVQLGDELSEEQLLARFRKAIVDKYRVAS